MALLVPLASTATNAEASQIIGTVNALIAQINANVGLGGLAQGAFVANATVATTMTSLGPTGSHTTIQKWLSLVDNTGTVVYLPCY